MAGGEGEGIPNVDSQVLPSCGRTRLSFTGGEDTVSFWAVMSLLFGPPCSRATRDKAAYVKPTPPRVDQGLAPKGRPSPEGQASFLGPRWGWDLPEDP